MPAPTRRRGARPDTQALDELAQAPAGGGGRLRKAPTADPVLSAGSPQPGPTERARGPEVDQDAAAARPARTPAAARPPRGERATPTASKAKVGFYQDPDHTARARAAYDWTRPQEGHRSFSDFIAAAVMREVARLEAKYHDGQPWPAVEPGQLPTGKPLGS